MNCKSNALKIFLCFQFFNLFLATSPQAQTAAPYVVNVAGKLVTVGNYHFEWSVGESAAITTMGNSDLLVTNGLLQFNVENQPETNLASFFLSDEIRVYPNPVRDLLEINILHASKGRYKIELLDEKGVQVKAVQLDYYGMGALEKWNLGGLTAGQYFLNIRQTHPVTGRLVKKGALKILKIN